MLLFAEPKQALTGLGLVGAGGLLILSWCNEWGSGPWPLLSVVSGNLWILAASWSMYRYPSTRLSANERRTFALFAAWLVTGAWLVVLLSRPEWHEFSARSWWPNIATGRERDTYDWANVLVQLVNCSLLVIYGRMWRARWRRATPFERRLTSPIAMAAISTSAAAAAVAISGAFGASERVTSVLLVAMGVTAISVPVAFVIAVTQQQRSHIAVTELLLRLSEEPSLARATSALREALDDPDLQVYRWDERDRRYVNDAGTVAQDATNDPNRWLVETESRDGARLAAVAVDRSLAGDPELARGLVSAFGMAIQNAQLLQTVQDQLDALRAASERSLRSADEERARLQRDLHDGAQVRFHGLLPRLGAAAFETTDDRTRADLDDMRHILLEALRELRSLSNGLRPMALRLGLAGAVRSACQEVPFRMLVELPETPLPASTQACAYFGIVEGVTNAAKHSSARFVRVSGRLDERCLHVEVADDGCGGARIDTGTGLAGITDRVTALGGELRLHSPAGAGTILSMRIPCG